MLPCPESKKNIFGNIRALFSPPNKSLKKDPPLSRFTRQTGDFGLSDTQRGDPRVYQPPAACSSRIPRRAAIEEE